jgi:cellulose synthase/poly-beta-1,6-N-acetylglucosamine synthase-like glycosyltransferase
VQAGADLIARMLLGAYLVVLALLSVYGLHRWHLLLLARRWGATPTAPPAEAIPPILPLITVQLPIYNERHVACRLLKAVCRLDYPRHRLQIQILDDSTDDTSARLARLAARARRLGFQVEHCRRRRRDGFKAGALAAGTADATGELVAIFDADFIPGPDFLRRTLPAFQDPRVGMVQARWGHVNRRSSLLTRVQSALLDGHFLVEHLARHRSGRFFNFNGTAGIWRRTCIVSAGGWQAQTLTEDLDLSYRAQLAGWRFVFLPDLIAPAELPTSMAAFKSQQHRWAKGSVQTARKLLGSILTSAIPWRLRVEAFFHLTGNAAYVLMVALCLLLWPVIRTRRDWASTPLALLDALVLAAASVSVAAFYLYSQRQAGRSRLESLLCLPAVMGVGVGLALTNGGAVLAALAGHASPFVRTPKDGCRDAGGAPGAPGNRQRRRRGAAYGSPARRLPYLEAALGLYLAVALLDTLRLGAWPWLPFLLIFTWGFCFNAWLGLREAWVGRRTSAR